ncbi:hypothetical protein OAB57_01980 [Bacteriovoracaceae bacterium]|nr:hypothetical protein [Bacteriovoracaceae bacterium]
MQNTIHAHVAARHSFYDRINIDTHFWQLFRKQLEEANDSIVRGAITDHPVGHEKIKAIAILELKDFLTLHGMWPYPAGKPQYEWLTEIDTVDRLKILLKNESNYYKDIVKDQDLAWNIDQKLNQIENDNLIHRV